MLLSYEIASVICVRLFSICDRADELATKLREQGFSAFDPRCEYILSFCPCGETRAVYEKCRMEEAKEFLSGAALDLPSVLKNMKARYSSPFVNRLKLERDQLNGCSEIEIERRFPFEEAWWRTQYDPCRRAWALAQLHDKADTEVKWQAALIDQDTKFAFERNRHASSIGEGREVSRDDRCRFVIEAAERHGAVLGFVQPKRRTSNQPYVRRKLTDDWELRWIVPDTRSFSFSPFIRRKDRLAQPHLDASLVLCASHLGNNLRKPTQAGEFLVIRYGSIIPDFTPAYRSFFDYEELEVIVKAHFTLLGFMIAEIESAVLDTLRDCAL